MVLEISIQGKRGGTAMNIIAGIDILSSLAILTAIFIIVISKKQIIKRDIRLLIIGLLLVTLGYLVFMIIEWLGISHSLEAFENIIGALIPLMWAFVIYSFIQYGINRDLTINKENLRITLNSIGDAVIATDIHSRITRMNPAAEILTGWKFIEVKGKIIEDAFSLVNAAARKMINNPVRKALETGKTVKLNNQTVLIGKDKTEYYIIDSAAPIFSDDQSICGAVLVFSDISESFKQEAKLRESEERFNLALNGTKAGLWDWFIRTGKIIFNNRWAEIIGYKLTELEPLGIDTWQKLTHPEDLIRFEELLEMHFNGKTEYFECEIRLKHKKGYWVWVIARGMVVDRDKQGNPLRITGTQIDISNQKRIEFELKVQMEENIALNEEYLSQNEELIKSIDRISKINEELNEAKLNAEESYRLKSAFLANMSHEIRTPMNGIIGFSELLKSPKLPEEKREYYAGIVIDSSKQLLTIVNDILDISQIETGKVSLVYEDVVINDLINNLFAFFEPQSTSKEIKLLSHKPLSNSLSTIRTDKTRLRQVLTNLLNNAIKFTSEGHIKFGYKVIDGYIEFFVEDTGIGIPEDLYEKVFEPFRQAELEISNQYGGTGLGLTISRKLVELLGGKIWLESQWGKGSVFYFTLPHNPNSSSVKNNEKQEKMISNNFFNMVVLVVEDDDVNYLFLETVLSKNKIKILRAFNGVEAVEICNNNPDIKLVLMDIKLPFMNGYEATKKIKKHNPDLPIIAQTAYAMYEDRNKALEAGCDEYISKPILTSELLKLIKKYSDKE
jgi:PAS domain S-box-containing protein